MKHLYSIFLLSLLALSPCRLFASSPSCPIATSFDSVFSAVNGVSTSELHSLLVIQHDSLLYERYGAGYGPDQLHACWSATKTLTAFAVGFALQDSLLDINTPIIRYFSADETATATSPYWQTLTLDHLLKMGSGFASDNITTRMRGGEDFDPVQEVFKRGFDYAPGTRWRYNNTDTYMAGIVVEKVTGKCLQDYLSEKLFNPLGINNFYYEKDARGHNLGATGLYLSPRSLAKIGLFMLHKEVMPDWIDRMTATHIFQHETKRGTDWLSGYCYQMWACKVPGVVRLDGMWGQYVIILPAQDAVVVMTSLCTNREVQMSAFWHYIYPNL